MAQYNFEGDIDNIAERQLEFINEVIKDLGYDNSKVTFAPVGVAGDNYVANVMRITIEGEHGTFTMIAKIAPSNETHRNLMRTDLLFNNELKMYSEVLPKFHQLQKQANVPEEEQLKYAKCYRSFIEKPNEVILLEDLKTLDYTMLDRFTPLPNDCIKSVLKNFAVYHSLSYALKVKEPATYDNYKTNLIDIWALPGTLEYSKAYFQGVQNDALTLLDEPEHVNIVKNKIVDAADIMFKLAKADNDSKYTVILQGDTWTNNIMFKFEGDNIESSIMIDYQISKNGIPVSDLMYMIFNCTDYESRKQHFYDWIDYYHTELEKSLSNYNLKANYVYPRDKLDADLKRYGKLSFGLSVFLTSLLIRKSDDAQKIIEIMQNKNVTERSNAYGVSQLDDGTKTLFKNRVVELYKSYTEFGLI